MTLLPLLSRELETGRLNAAWERAQGGQAQLVVVWGRRRTGKTFLLSHFVAGKRAIFFGATQQAEAIELTRLQEAVARDGGPELADMSGGRFAGWEAALRFFAAASRAEPLVVVLDEVPYLARSTPGFASVVQAVWDHLPADSRLMLVLTGSAVGAMETMLGAQGPLRGRPTVTLRLDPVGIEKASEFWPDLSPVSLVEAYAACGGYPLHLKAWDQAVSTRDNLLGLAGSPGGVLLEDAEGILGEELPDTGGYPRILAAIGRGRTRMSEIQNEADQRVEHPLDVLVRSGMVRRSLPLGAPKRARPLYEIDDVYLAFWFRVLYSDLAQMAGGNGPAVLTRRQPQWLGHLGWLFERMARAHASHLVTSGVLPEDLLVGRWWASSGPPCEVDVLGMRGSRTEFLGEARWQDSPLGLRDLRDLTAKSVHVPHRAEDVQYALWGRRGVEPEVLATGALGFSLEDMLTR